MTKNIVICCDGTGNEVCGNLSNVLKLFRIVEKSDLQRVYYDPGVGTIGNRNAWARLRQKVEGVFGLATGAGIDDNVLDAYRFLATTYEDGDRVFLFGFSRGAYTVRMLAGFLHMVGLLGADQLNLADYALTAYKRASEEHNFQIAWDFGRTTSARHLSIHFIGAWDTVASMLVPRPDRMYLPSPRTLPYTRRNPSVRAFRHAIAIDERRVMFRLNRWTEPQPFIENPFSKEADHPPQDIKQVWFAGVHSDVGGGYPEKESGLSKFPLMWMINEAVEHGLRISSVMFDHLACGIARPGGTHEYEPPNAAADQHNSLTPGWWTIEWIPKLVKFREWKRPSFLGLYIPWGEPRAIPDSAIIHPSVEERRAARSDYRPVNLPPRS